MNFIDLILANPVSGTNIGPDFVRLIELAHNINNPVSLNLEYAITGVTPISLKDALGNAKGTYDYIETIKDSFAFNCQEHMIGNSPITAQLKLQRETKLSRFINLGWDEVRASI